MQSTTQKQMEVKKHIGEHLNAEFRKEALIAFTNTTRRMKEQGVSWRQIPKRKDFIKVLDTLEDVIPDFPLEDLTKQLDDARAQFSAQFPRRPLSELLEVLEAHRNDARVSREEAEALEELVIRAEVLEEPDAKDTLDQYNHPIPTMTPEEREKGLIELFTFCQSHRREIINQIIYELYKNRNLIRWPVKQAEDIYLDMLAWLVEKYDEWAGSPANAKLLTRVIALAKFFAYTEMKQIIHRAELEILGWELIRREDRVQKEDYDTYPDKNQAEADS